MGIAVTAALLVAGLGIAFRSAPTLRGRTSARRRLGGVLRGTGRTAAVDRGARAPALLLHPPAWLEARLADAGIGADPQLAATAAGGALLALVAASLLAGGPALAAISVGAAAVGSMLYLRARRGSAGARFEAGLPVALEAVARALRSGASLGQAVAEAAEATPGPLGSELRLVAAQAGHGQPLVTALEGLAARRALGGVRLAVAALCLGAETGGSQARAIDGVASTIRDRLAVAAELRALSAQARLSALVIGLAPLAFGAIAAATDARTSDFLLQTPAGLAFLVAGLGLDCLGWQWMRRLCRVAT